MKFRVGKAVLSFTLTSLHCLSAFPVQAQQYDLVIKGGHVIDPKNQIWRARWNNDNLPHNEISWSVNWTQEGPIDH